MTRRLGAVCCFLMVLELGLSTRSVAAEPPTISDVHVGFKGVYKVGFWTPVEVTLQGGSESFTGHVEVIVPDGDGVPVRVVNSPDRPVQVFPGQKTRVSLNVKFGRTDGHLIVRFVAGGLPRAERRFQTGDASEHQFIPLALPSTDRLILSIGPSLGLREAMPKKRQAMEPDSHVVELSEAFALPDQWFSYEGVDALVISLNTSKTFLTFYREDRVQAIHQWVRLGGKLLICAGEEASIALASGASLTDLLPGRFDKMRSLRQVSSIESYCETQIPMEVPARDFQVEVPRLVDLTGNIEAFAGSDPSGLPLVVRSPRGFGQIIFFALDLSKPPISDWESRPLLIRKLLDIEQGANKANQQQGLARVNTLGYVDLVGQLRAALDRFEGVTVVPFWIVGGLVLIYVLVIGPLDYWLVRKILRRPGATWVTFPLWVFLICAAAYGTSCWLKGRELVTNQIEIIDVDAASGLARGTAWASIFSPQADTYDLSFEVKPPGQVAAASDPKVLLSWMGLPGSGLGGMNARSTNPPLFEQPYEVLPDLSQLHGVPIQIWSTKHLAARWNCQVEIPAMSELVEDIDQLLSGTLTNQLDFDIADAHLFYDRWVYPISRLRQRERISIGQSLQPLTTRTFLTRQRIIGGKDVASKYAEGTTQIPRIIEMMMFHRTAGGAQYTAGLPNRYQAYCELSQHLKLGRAMLVFRKTEGGSQLKRDGTTIHGNRDRRWTFYRLVLAVDRGKKE